MASNQTYSLALIDTIKELLLRAEEKNPKSIKISWDKVDIGGDCYYQILVPNIEIVY